MFLFHNQKLVFTLSWVTKWFFKNLYYFSSQDGIVILHYKLFSLDHTGFEFKLLMFLHILDLLYTDVFYEDFWTILWLLSQTNHNVKLWFYLNEALNINYTMWRLKCILKKLFLLFVIDEYQQNERPIMLIYTR